MLQCIKKKRIQGDNQSCHFPEKSDDDEIESTEVLTSGKWLHLCFNQGETLSLFRYIWQI